MKNNKITRILVTLLSTMLLSATLISCNSTNKSDSDNNVKGQISSEIDNLDDKTIVIEDEQESGYGETNPNEEIVLSTEHQYIE